MKERSGHPLKGGQGSAVSMTVSGTYWKNLYTNYSIHKLSSSPMILSRGTPAQWVEQLAHWQIKPIAMVR